MSFGKLVQRHIREFSEQIESVDADDPEAFMDLMSVASRFYGVHYAALAKRINMDPSTVSRWVAKKVAPHHMIRRSVVLALKEHLREFAENYE